MSIKIFLADDHQGFRQALRALLSGEPDFVIIGEATDGRTAVAEVVRCCPDVAILDLVMPELDGIAATRQICQSVCSVQVIILSMYGTEPYVRRAIAAGARGYLLKEFSGSELVRAIHTVHAGLPFIGANLIHYSLQ